MSAELAQIAREVSVCTACALHRSRLKAVPGEGPDNAAILFIGEAPGWHENQQGRPFVGPAGQFLEELLVSIGMRREQVYICNVVKCFISPRVLIYTAEGYKPIKDIRVGDLVLTHKGHFRKVVYIRPHEVLPQGSEIVRLTLRSQEIGNTRPLHLTITPEHPFLVNGDWKLAKDIQLGDKLQALGDRCEVCGRTYFVRYDRYEHRSFHTCGPLCHNRRVMHSEETKAKIKRVMEEQYSSGMRDRATITARAHERTRELVAAGEAKIQHMTTAERHRGRVALAANVTAGKKKHRTGFGEEELKVILNRIEVDYVHHFAFPNSALLFDFCLPYQKILIEVRGPSFNINRKMQARALEKDRLAADNGYLVINFWWVQIIQQPAMVEALLRRLLRNHEGDYVFVDVVVTEVEHRHTGRSFPLYNIGVEEDESYIAAGAVSHNCRPPENRDPLPDEIKACEPYLDRQIALIKPKLIVTLGRYSMAKFFPKETISKIHGLARRRGDFVVLALYHPAAALHQPRYKADIEADFLKIPQLLAEASKVEEAPSEATPEQLSLF